MKKSSSKATAAKTAPVTPVKMGSKRACVKCKTKFYDFEKQEFSCPKCHTEMTQEDFAAGISFAELKRNKPERKPVEAVLADDAAGEADDAFESVDDLGDDDDVVEEIEVDDDEDDDASY